MLRAVIFDYPQTHLHRNEARELFGDLIVFKQRAFERTKRMFVAMDKHDMISTHVLIYDVQNIHGPRLVLAIRNSYETRTRRYEGLDLPYAAYLDAMGPDGKAALEKFRADVGPLVNCDMWCVDPEYTFKDSGQRISELAFFLICLQTLRAGFSHFMGCANERYKASRWVAPIGTLRQGVRFQHPTVPGEHRLILLERFDREWLEWCATSYGDVVARTWDLVPDELGYPSLPATMDQLRAGRLPMDRPPEHSDDTIAREAAT